MTKKRIAFDQDQVLVDLLGPWLDRYNKDYDDNLTKEQITDWNFCHIVKPECGNKIYTYLDYSELFENLPPMEGSQEVLELMIEKYDIHIVTAPFNNNNIVAKHRNLRKHFPFLDPDKFVFTRDKSIVAADYLIDDKPANLEGFRGTPLLFDAPHNRKENRFKRFKNWHELRGYFLKEHLEYDTFDRARLAENKFTRAYYPSLVGKPVDILKRVEGEFDYLVLLPNQKVDFIKAKDIDKY